MDRDLTEQGLERAALALLARDGVLSGLNLREVADEAGVNRGLVYHYFGSRQELLRAALRRGTKERLSDVMHLGEPSLLRRLSLRFGSIIQHRDAIKLIALLSLDADPRVRVVYAKRMTVPEISQGMADGIILPGIMPEALLAALNALMFGYAIFRENYARELGVPIDRLDSEVQKAMLRLLTGDPRVAGAPTVS